MSSPMPNDVFITEDFLLREDTFASPGFKPLKESKEQFEKNYLIQLIELTQGNISKAAEISGKYRADLYELLKKHGLKPKDFR